MHPISFYADVEVPVFQDFRGNQVVAPWLLKAYRELSLLGRPQKFMAEQTCLGGVARDNRRANERQLGGILRAVPTDRATDGEELLLFVPGHAA